MPRRLILLAAALAVATPAFALDLPTRKAGLWEIKMEFQGHSNLPMQTMKQCTDAASDKLMTYNFGGSAEKNCQKQDFSRSGSAIVINSVCAFGGATTTSHAVVNGDFNSAYTVEVTSKREGGPSDSRRGAGRRDAYEDRGPMGRRLRRGPAAGRRHHEQRHDPERPRHSEGHSAARHGAAAAVAINRSFPRKRESRAERIIPPPRTNAAHPCDVTVTSTSMPRKSDPWPV